MNERTERPLGKLTRLYLLVLVTLTGAVVLALEILGTRVIGTYYGSSLYVWAALLTVTLICLAIGYALGGRLADWIPRPEMLCALVMLAGGAVLATPALTWVLEPVGERLGLRWGAVVSALIIFAGPLTLLAMAGPYVIRLRARTVAGVGSTSGAVYALSTVGSVGGVLAVSMWMIPSLGTRVSLMTCAAVLVAAGGIGLLLRGRLKPAVTATALLGLILSVSPFLLERSRPPVVTGQLYYCESPFGELRVLQTQSEQGRWYRLLMVNGIKQTGMPLDIELVDGGSMLRETDYFLELLPYFRPLNDTNDADDPDQAEANRPQRRGVLIGLAGGMFARVMEFYDIEWTAVEIDVKVAELAAAYFGYRGTIAYPDGRTHAVDLARFPARESPVLTEHFELLGEHSHSAARAQSAPGRAVIQDGRHYLARNRQPVQFIVLDAYNSDTIPFHLITREFFELVRGRLTDDGILAINYIGPATGDFVTDSLFRTLADVFQPDRVEAYGDSDDPSAIQNITVFAFRQPMKPNYGWRKGDQRGEDEVDNKLAARRIDVAGASGMVITDDHNPVDLRRAETALKWRLRTGAELNR